MIVLIYSEYFLNDLTSEWANINLISEVFQTAELKTVENLVIVKDIN